MPSTAGLFGLFDSITPSGRKKTKADEEQSQAARQMREIAQELFRSTSGLRSGTIGGLEGFLNTGQLPTSLQPNVQVPLTVGREGLENQFNVARQNIMNRIPSQGGQLNQNLAQAEIGRAQGVGRLEADVRTQIENPLRQFLFSSALGTGFGAPPTSISGLGGASSQFGDIAQRNLTEQMERERRHKEEVQSVSMMAVT